MNTSFDDIRPFHDDEVPQVIEQLCQVPYFLRILAVLFPSVPVEQVVVKLKTIRSVDGFQNEFIIPYLNNLIATTTDGVTASGLDGLDPKGGYLFMSNHRDIILDSALMNVKLHEHGFNTTEIAIGSNLLIYDWITDLVKLNKSFVVKRNLPVRQMMEASATLSAYIRDSITARHQNIWIAQREGRSKDGNDLTQGSVLKMLNLSGSKNSVDDFAELNIVPVSITYEYDPCDYLKAHQFQLKRDHPDYHKSPSEDLTHMSSGLSGRKGRIHFSFGKPINDSLSHLANLNKNAQITQIAEMIDHHIHAGYHLWPDSYVAADILEKNEAYAAKGMYSPDDKAEFIEYIEEHISRLDDCDEPFVRSEVLKMYANPLFNQLKATQGK